MKRGVEAVCVCVILGVVFQLVATGGATTMTYEGSPSAEGLTESGGLTYSEVAIN